MNCLEFKEIALSNPSHEDDAFLKHQSECAECEQYLHSIKKMDADLANSLSVDMPADLIARLKLTNEFVEQERVARSTRRYSLVASIAVVMFVSALFLTGQFNFSNTVESDYEQLLSAVMEHSQEKSTPVWKVAKANETVKALMASYDGKANFNYMENLRFSRICPMGKYRGLHATMQTSHGQVTFAYIKGKPVGELFDSTYNGYMARVKPVKGGNVVILSRTDNGIKEVDEELTEAMYWDI